MTKRVVLNEVPYKGINVGEKVMYLSGSGQCTGMDFGFYRGLHRNLPVVERFYSEKKWHWDAAHRKMYRDTFESLISRRVVLKRRRIWSISTLKVEINNTPTAEDIQAKINKPG